MGNNVFDEWEYMIVGNGAYSQERREVAGYAIRISKRDGSVILNENARIPDSCDNIQQFVMFYAQKAVLRFLSGLHSPDIYMKPHPVSGFEPAAQGDSSEETKPEN